MSKKPKAPPPTQQQRLINRVHQASCVLEQKPGATPEPKVKCRSTNGRNEKPAA